MAAGGGGGGGSAGLTDDGVVGGADWTCAGVGGTLGTFSGGMTELEEGVAGVGAGLPGPPGPRGISTLGGAVEAWENPGSELSMESFLSANDLRCEEFQLVV